MTRATISIKIESGIYDQIWYVNSSGYPEVLGKDIYTHLKTVDDVVSCQRYYDVIASLRSNPEASNQAWIASCLAMTMR